MDCIIQASSRVPGFVRKIKAEFLVTIQQTKNIQSDHTIYLKCPLGYNRNRQRQTKMNYDMALLVSPVQFARNMRPCPVAPQRINSSGNQQNWHLTDGHTIRSAAMIYIHHVPVYSTPSVFSP
jgi:hypothetical protein